MAAQDRTEDRDAEDLERAAFFRGRRKELARLQAVLDRLLAGRGSPRVLDAGCGCPRAITFGPGARIVALDISPDELQDNPVATSRVLADLERSPLARESFDVAVCFEVLEHLARPDEALDDLIGVLRPGGVLVVGAPSILSAKGLVAKLSPHALHELAYRRLLHRSGDGHRHRHRVVMRLSMAPRRVERFMLDRGLSLEHFAMYEAPVQTAFKSRHPRLALGWAAVRHATRAVSGGRVDNDLTDYIAVFRRPLLPGLSERRGASP